MFRHRQMIAGVLLLCAFVVHGCNGIVLQENTCESNQTVECFHPLDHLNASLPVRLEVDAGKMLFISLDGLHSCSFSRGSDAVPTTNRSSSMTPPVLSESYSGEYTLRCGHGFSLSFSLHVITKRPTIPRLTLVRVDISGGSPYFNCASQGIPNPTLRWSGGQKGGGVAGKNENIISSIEFQNNVVMCCANNSQGQECSKLYDYDVSSDLMRKEEVSSLIISPGQPLLLRCRAQRHRWNQLTMWEKDGQLLTSTALPCPAKIKEKMCIRNDKDLTKLMTYLFIDSVTTDHNGTYTCKDQTISKSVDVSVLAEGFLKVQLDPRKTLLAENAPRACLEAAVFYHPTLEYCMWQTPRGILSKCITEDWVTKQRTVKFCGGLQSGEYKLTVKAGGQNTSKSVFVCVVDEPKFRLTIDKHNHSTNIQTESAVPANYTWLSCFSPNESCSGLSHWTEVPESRRTDSDVHCRKTIESSIIMDLPDAHYVKFCLANSVGSWCSLPHPVYFPSSPQASKGDLKEEKYIFTVLKTGSVILVVALFTVSLALIYHVKKKKPQYQPQLQMIQMVGPNDNDYIYINFKDFEYDRKWEFPRENLELGKELGSGAFGTVVQGTAYGIKKAGVSQQVAVKMLKEKHQAVEKEALMSELKMLTHIGQHSNIVNLLGACTESGPIYLIFQYCCHGDLLNYLKSSSERYHKSAVDAVTKDRNSSLYQNLTPGKNSTTVQEGDIDKYVPMHVAYTEGQENIALLHLDSDDLDSLEDQEIDENGNTNDLQALTFEDLLSFAVQVAKGMEFLSSKNCIHRDLAARNVLVTKGRLVKIADFGLARDIDNDSNYVVRGNVRLPVKWMAPESIFQGMYTMKSDVWAYGILLWEIFSLGVTPYPGVKVDHGFYSRIQNGFKMECPYYADESVYGMMCKCWALNPENRPSFSKLVAFMSDHLTVSEEKLYQNIINHTSGDYHNASAISDASAFAQQNKNEALSDENQVKMYSEKQVV
ncbi:receptor-type tyrosine-protein kinase FLT3 [Corythoichthys intestinalis]|uniref:receptor-type tyrosine-protein kinase FLT3 n=1 Tax=Corythoichthys intestinalis TaxID=161448 RepID=UPI0025A50B57|nr:receptor-type tyrosine-protein kinase FLT3 [Corythoichthys intestinalis]